MELLLIVLLVVFMAGGLFLVPLGLPGNFVVLGSALLYALATGFREVSWGTLGLLLALALLGEGIEAVAGAVGAGRHGSGKAGMIAAVVGGVAGAIVGAPFLLGLGALLGAAAGAFAGATLVELVRGRTLRQAARAGWGTLLGRLAGTAAKIVIGVAMAAICLARVLG